MDIRKQNLKESRSFHIPNPITSTLPEKSDKAILDSSGRLTTFEKLDCRRFFQDRIVMLGFISDLNAFISLRSKSKPA
ncbi:hypothetical protein IKQ19_11750, partial [Candidatus Saccharibacteria bacterium]|nr:hypothetical protein [Candidatus Saccharibacteria bacterium]